MNTQNWRKIKAVKAKRNTETSSDGTFCVDWNSRRRKKENNERKTKYGDVKLKHLCKDNKQTNKGKDLTYYKITRTELK